jgi:hypothetical protein
MYLHFIFVQQCRLSIVYNASTKLILAQNWIQIYRYCTVQTNQTLGLCIDMENTQ